MSRSRSRSSRIRSPLRSFRLAPTARTGSLRRSPLGATLIGLLLVPLIGLLLGDGAALAATVEARASTQDGSPLSGITVGARIDLTLAVRPADGESLAAFDLELDWASGRAADPLSTVGALVLGDLPGALDRFTVLSLDPACTDAIGQPFGQCDVGISLPAPLPSGTATDVLALSLFYDWVAPPGYEICVPSPGDPSCVASNGGSLEVVAWLATPQGDRSSTSVNVTNLGVPGLRVIPEPGTACLLALGLLGLGMRRGPRPTRGAPPRPTPR